MLPATSIARILDSASSPTRIFPAAHGPYLDGSLGTVVMPSIKGTLRASVNRVASPLAVTSQTFPLYVVAIRLTPIAPPPRFASESTKRLNTISPSPGSLTHGSSTVGGPLEETVIRTISPSFPFPVKICPMVNPPALALTVASLISLTKRRRSVNCAWDLS